MLYKLITNREHVSFESESDNIALICCSVLTFGAHVIMRHAVNEGVGYKRHIFDGDFIHMTVDRHSIFNLHNYLNGVRQFTDTDTIKLGSKLREKYKKTFISMANNLTGNNLSGTNGINLKLEELNYDYEKFCQTHQYRYSDSSIFWDIVKYCCELSKKEEEKTPYQIKF